jgi:small subunit ribosomal protein S3Ae
MVAHRYLSEKIPTLTIDQFVREITGNKGEEVAREASSKVSSEILVEARKIANIRHIGIKKTKLISTPESRAIEEAKPVEVIAESRPDQ